jgi:hypothetical protein
MSEIHVTFVASPYLGQVAQAFPDHTEFGAVYEADFSGATMQAILWSYEQAPDNGQAFFYNPVDAWRVIDNMPVGAVTLDFDRAVATLSEAFGLYIPCKQGS